MMKMHSKLLYKGIDERSDIVLSIVIPTYKRSQYLNDSIESVIKQKTTSIKYEIIVINNEPSADMSDLILKYKSEPILFYVNEENYGQVGNINQGIHLSKGKFVALLHDDDALLDNYFSVIMKYITQSKYDFDCIITSKYQMRDRYCMDMKHKFLSIVFAYRFLYRKKEKYIYPRDNVNSLRNIYSVPTCGMILRKQAIEEFGYFKDVNGAAWDYYNFRQFNKKYKVLIQHEFVAVRRMYTGMSNYEAIQQEFTKEKLAMIQENPHNKYACLFGPPMALKKPKIKFIAAYIISTIYFYSKNLDVDKMLPKRFYKELVEGGVLKI